MLVKGKQLNPIVFDGCFVGSFGTVPTINYFRLMSCLKRHENIIKRISRTIKNNWCKKQKLHDK